MKDIYGLNLQVKNNLQDIKDNEKELNGLEIMKFSFTIATYAIYFSFATVIFAGISVWGLQDYLFGKTSNMIALIWVVIIIFMIPLALSLGKHFNYQSISKSAISRNRSGVIIHSMIALALISGVYYEAISSSANLQAKAFTAVNYKDNLASIMNSGNAVSTDTDLSRDLARAETLLAQCKDKEARGLERHCKGTQANVDSLKSQINLSHQANAAASANAVTAKGGVLQNAVDEQSLPAAKWFAETFKMSNDGGTMMIVIIAALFFELIHLTTVFSEIRALIRKQALKTEGEQLQNAYFNATGKVYNAGDFKDDRVIDLSGQPMQDNKLQEPDLTPRSQPLFKYSQSAPVAGFAAKAKEIIGNELMQAQAGREQADLRKSELAGQLGQAINNLTQPNLTAPAQPDLKTGNLTDLTAQPDPKTDNLTDRATDLTDRSRTGAVNRPTLDYKTAVGMISAQVRGQVESGKCPAEQRPIEIACMVTYDQLAGIYPMPELDLPLIAKSILANIAGNLPEPDPTAPNPPAPENNLTGQVGQVSLGQGQVSPQPDLEMIKKLAALEEKSARLEAQLEADRKAAEAEKVRLAAKEEADRKAAERLAAAKRTEAEARAKAEAQAKAKAEAEAKAQAGEAQKRAEAEAEAAERGKLTEDQVNIAATAIAAAIKTGQVQTLGFGNLAPILKEAGLPRSSDSLRVLIKLGCRKLTGMLTAPNPNAGNGKPDYIINLT